MYRETQFEGEDKPILVLTEKGLYETISRLNVAKKERRDAIAFWFTLTTGILGALIGLISVIKK